MSKLINVVNKHLIVYIQFLKLSLITQMEYRWNFSIGFIVESGFIFTKIMYLIVIYNLEITIIGYSADEIFLYVGTFSIITAFYTGFIMINFYEIPNNIKKGDLDLLIIKPVSLQFMLTLRKIDFSMILSNFLGGTAMVIMAILKLNIDLTFSYFLGYILLIFLGVIVAYTLFLIPQLLSFWIIETKAIFNISDKAWDFNTMPMVIYTKIIQRIGIFLIPIFTISNFPSMFLVGKISNTLLIWAYIVPIILFVLVRIFWNYAIKNYSSASS
ncbi:ABC transporter permease [Bacillus subtilis]|uniref:ABC transporter permease n=1 Tax=Bacillus subtilis TaxID=1423 RepID=UPI003000E56D